MLLYALESLLRGDEERLLWPTLPRNSSPPVLTSTVRNPIYIGQVAVLVGLGLYLRSVSILVFALLWFVLLHLFVLYLEEPNLRKKFGATYEGYCQAVRRWIPSVASAKGK